MPDLINSMSVNQTGSSTDADDLLSKLRIFLTDNGFGEDRYETITNGHQATYNKNGFYYNFRSFNSYPPYKDASNGDDPISSDLTNWENTSGIAFKMSTSYDGLLPWDEQPGSILGNDESIFIQTKENGSSENIERYDFFTTDDNDDPSLNIVAVICEYENNKFSHMYFGEICKFNTFTGGGFMSATQRLGAVSNNPGTIEPCLGTYEDVYTEINVDSVIEKEDLRGSIEIRSNAGGFHDVFIHSREDLKRSKIPFNEKGALIPPIYYHRDTAPSPDEYYPLGTIPYCFTVYMEHYNPLETFYLGGRRYVVFPYYTKPVPFTDEVDESSGLGVAIKIPTNWGE